MLFFQPERWGHCSDGSGFLVTKHLHLESCSLCQPSAPTCCVISQLSLWSSCRTSSMMASASATSIWLRLASALPSMPRSLMENYGESLATWGMGCAGESETWMGASPKDWQKVWDRTTTNSVVNWNDNSWKIRKYRKVSARYLVLEYLDLSALVYELQCCVIRMSLACGGSHGIKRSLILVKVWNI